MQVNSKCLSKLKVVPSHKAHLMFLGNNLPSLPKTCF